MKRSTSSIMKKEFLSYFISPSGYIFVVIFLALTSWLYFRGFFIAQEASMRIFFGIMPWIFLIFIPAMTMRSFAEEQRSGTFEILTTLPLSSSSIVWQKFLSSLYLLFLTLLFTFSIPVTLAIIGSPDFGEIVSGYLGLILVGSSYIAIGIFSSSLTKNQVVAFILGVFISFALFIIGEDLVTISLPTFLGSILQYSSLSYHFKSIMRGVIDSRDIIYYLSVDALFLYATYMRIKRSV